jgi:CRISPR/Cas system-associated exonuclease Cas4 (RecB family)
MKRHIIYAFRFLCNLAEKGLHERIFQVYVFFLKLPFDMGIPLNVLLFWEWALLRMTLLTEPMRHKAIEEKGNVKCKKSSIHLIQTAAPYLALQH